MTVIECDRCLPGQNGDRIDVHRVDQLPCEHVGLAIQRLTAGIVVPRELLADMLDMQRAYAPLLGPDTRTPAERAAAKAEREAEDARKLADAQARHAAARAKVDGKLAEVLDAHGPMSPGYALWPVCLGCDIDGYDAEPPEWPCSTWALIADESH